MDKNTLATKIYEALNRELLRRYLIKYFFTKGLKEAMNKKIYPPMIQDITAAIPKLMGKIELEPFVEDINPLTGVVKLGWNLFTLGNQRMFLGYSTHANLNSVNTAIYSPVKTEGIQTLKYRTPKQIITFILDTLGSSKECDMAGDIPQHVSSAAGISVLPGLVSDNGGFFRRNTFVN